MAILKSDKGEFSYTVKRRKGMKNIVIRITGDGEVVVSAAPSVPLASLEDFVARKSDAIMTALDKQRVKPTEQAGEYLDGALLSIFGEELTLKVTTGEREPYTSGGFLHISVADPDNEAMTELAVMTYIAARGRELCSSLVKKYCDISGAKTPGLSMKLLKSRWGRYSVRDNEIQLNFALAGLPFKYCEYVAAHEVTHIFIRNHSERFYAFGEKLLPGFKALDRELNRYPARLNLFRNKRQS